MADETDLEARVSLLERAMGGAFGELREARIMTVMLTAALSTLVDDKRPGNVPEADAWFDHLLKVALTNVGWRSDHVIAQIVREGGPDALDRVAAEKADRAEVADRLTDYFLAMKHPQGSVE